MIADSVLTSLGVMRYGGKVIDIPETHPDYVRRSKQTDFKGIYALNEWEMDDQCQPDSNDTNYGLGYYLSYIVVPYPLVKPHCSYKNPQLYISNCVRYAIDFCHACVIGGQVAFLDVPDDEHAGYNLTAVSARRLWDIPSLRSNYYLTGEAGAYRLLNRILPNRTSRDVAEFLKQLESALKFREELHFDVDDSIVTTADGYAFRINVNAKDPDDVWQMLPPVTPEDHILRESRLPVYYNPAAPVNDTVDTVLAGWSGDKGSDKWWRNLEVNFASLMLPAVKYKGIGVNIGAGGAGMTSMNDVRCALFGKNSIFVGFIDELAGQFGLGYLGNKRAFVVDDAPEGAMSNKGASILKTLATGQGLPGKQKGIMDTVEVCGIALILNSNEFPEFSQREARHNAVLRRVQTVLHNNIFDDARIIDPAKRAARPDLIEQICNDGEAMSYMLNLVMEATTRVIMRHGYTPVDEDIQFTRRALGEQDVISEFFETLGGVYGQDWDAPKLYHFGIKDEAVLFPAWHDCSPNTSNVMDTATERNWNHLTTGDCCYPLRMVNETAILYKLYVQYCHDSGSKAILKRKNFKSELCRTGFDEIFVRDPFGRQARIIVPAGTTNNADGFADFRKEQAAEHDAKGFTPADCADAPRTLANEVPAKVISELSADLNDSRWSDVDAMAHDAGNTYDTQVIAKWLHRFEDKNMTIDDIVAEDPTYYDHDALLAVLKVGIRAVQTAYGFDELGAHHVA